MNKFVFKKYRNPDNEFDNSDLEMTIEAEGLTEILEDFLDFLSGCGYNVTDLRNEIIYGEVKGED